MLDAASGGGAERNWLCCGALIRSISDAHLAGELATLNLASKQTAQSLRRPFDDSSMQQPKSLKIPPRATSETLLLLLLLLCYQILTRRAADLLHCSSPSGVLFIARAIANKIISSGGELQNLHNFTQREQIGAHATLFLAA